MDCLDLAVRLFDRRYGGGVRLGGLEDRRRGGEAETAAVLGGARARAAALTRTLGGTHDAEQLALTVLVARVLSGLWVQRRWRPEDLSPLLEEIAGIADVPVDSFTLGVSLYTLCDPGLLELPPRLAMEAQVELLRALARLDDVSLWCKESGGRVKCYVHAGPAAPSRRACEVARDAMEGRDSEGGHARRLYGVAVMRWQTPHAAIVGRVGHNGRDRGMAFLDQASAMISPILERASLLERNAVREASLVKAGERRLTRLGFDLHDQPLQEVAALATEMRSFRHQLANANGGAGHRRLLVGRVQDLEARLAALGEGLRALCHSLEPPTLLARPLSELLQREMDAYASRTDMHVDLTVDGELDNLTDSQRIALFRVVQECLSNTREHSGASEVQVKVCSTDSHITASVIDDGRGFEVEPTLLEAARRGRLGLVGVHERVRLLGGTCEVKSQTGGPTTVSIWMSRWQRLPLSSEVAISAS